MRHSDIIPQTTRAVEKSLFTLATPAALLLPPLKSGSTHKKTLILDLDETLVHSVTTQTKKAALSLMFKIHNKPNVVHVLFRPYAEEFLQKAAELYELVIFTASQKYYADYVINKLDSKNLVAHRLYREHCVISSKKFIKDLSNIGRPLKDVIIVDNSPVAYEWNSDCAIPIETWIGKEDDNALEQLLEVLKDLSQVEDVRKFLAKPWEHGDYNYKKISERIKSEATPLTPEPPKEIQKPKEQRDSVEKRDSCRPKARSSVGLREESIPKVETSTRKTVGTSETKPRRLSSIRQIYKPLGGNQVSKKSNPYHIVLRSSANLIENKENVDTKNKPRLYSKPSPLQSVKNVLRTEQKVSVGYNYPKESNRMINIYYPKNRHSDIRETSFLKDFDTPKYGILPNPWKHKNNPLIIKGNCLIHNTSYNRHCEDYRNYGSP
jgi:Dullard-like phosphatase family protein